MLKRVRTDEVRLGMFLHKLEGPWLSHPFWRMKFLLDSPQKLEKLRSSAVEWVHIDVALGADVADDKPASAAAPSATPPAGGRSANVLQRARSLRENRVSAPALISREEGFDPLSKAPRSMGAEMATAGALARKSAKIMRGVVDQVRLGKAIKATTLEPMVEEISCSIQRNPHAFNGMTRLKKTSEYLYLHSLSVCALMINLAQQLKLGPVLAQKAGMAGLLMDVGMGHVPIEIYEKESALNPDEERIIQSHTTLAHEFLTLGGDMPQEVLDVCLSHHERLDGTGYPHGLSGDQISLFARMAAICDTYDAMTSRRPHKPGRDPSVVLQMMSDMTGKFDPELLDAFVRAVGIYPVGSLVRLKSDRLAIVYGQDPHDLTLPRVRAFFTIADGRFNRPEDIELANCFGQDGIVSRENPGDWPIEDWESLSGRLVEKANQAKA
jgi:HD-GYP domain-containing protein (c-di-GMP phosphodiesterase class II)